MSFISETEVKAVRKAHRCAVCGTQIEIGEPAIRWAGKPDGDFHSAIMHSDCLAAERRFNEDTLQGEWYPLRYDRMPDDNQWLLADFPKVAERLGIGAELNEAA